jgi:ribosome biogenesis GTPase
MTDGAAACVVECYGRRVVVETDDGTRLPAELFGKRLTCVCGDTVRIRMGDSSGDVARVTAIDERRSLFARTDSRGRSEPLAANLTVLAVILAPEPAPDAYIIDRYLAGAALAGIGSIVIATKADLPTSSAHAFEALLDEYRGARYRVLTVSGIDGNSIDTLRTLLHGERTMLVGQSGMGKSTLTNALVPESARVTRTLSEATGEGRHTTVSTSLIRLPGGGDLVDSPGVRDYAPPTVEDAMVQVGWPEILALAPECRFNNCLHIREPACAVTNALARGTVAPRRFESYKRLLNIMRGLAPEYERRR